ncbi:hypothetical protein ACLNGM_14910 [Aureimonas phyllosphaerae]|uniref:hypothetical protein n=1 Tax=Aureimonas phyllosphaerae TaxID=1166078 RepID=UPI003A5BC0FE
MPRIPQSDHPIPIGRTLAASMLGATIVGLGFYGALWMAEGNLAKRAVERQEAFRSVRTASMEQGR